MDLLKKVCLTLLLLLGIMGCSCKNRAAGWMQDSEKLKVLSTTAQIGGLVDAIGGDRVEGLVLIQGDLDPHSYEMVKGDGEKVAHADLIFYNGLGLEHGASLSAILRDSPKAMAVGEKIGAAYPERILRKGKVVDPHIWMDISLWKKGIGPIVEALSQADPEGAPFYRDQGVLVARQMEEAHRE